MLCSYSPAISLFLTLAQQLREINGFSLVRSYTQHALEVSPRDCARQHVIKGRTEDIEE